MPVSHRLEIRNSKGELIHVDTEGRPSAASLIVALLEAELVAPGDQLHLRFITDVTCEATSGLADASRAHPE
jgi:hypothetical protein